MGQGTKIIIIFLWLFQALIQKIAWLYWWQVKEYRLDRFKLLFESKEGQKNLYLSLIFLKLILLTSLLFFTWPETFKSFFIFFLFLLVNGQLLIQLYKKGLRRPTLTFRVLSILFLFFFLSLASFFLFFGRSLVILIFVQEILLFLSPSLGILITSPFVRIMKNKEVTRAKKVLAKTKPIVIGITGSYGKTTTKDFLAQLLSQKYQTAKTEGSENTELGIARKTIKNVNQGTKFFVVEMGAYKIGEIKTLTEIVNPSVGIITGINEQHLALFGSKENIVKTKFELVESLPNEGIAVFNYSNPDCLKMAIKAKNLKNNLKIYGYSVGKQKSQIQPDLKAKILSASIKRVNFEVWEKGEKIKLFAPLPGTSLLENLLGAILVARIFKISWKEISQGCQNLKLPQKTMRVCELKSGAVLIDNSFNTNPKGFAAALDFLKYFRGKKRAVITGGIIELGRKSNEIHQQLGKLIPKVAEKIILTNQDFAESFKIGLGKNPFVLREITNIRILKQEFLDLIKSKYVILLEGRSPKILEEIYKEFEK